MKNFLFTLFISFLTHSSLQAQDYIVEDISINNMVDGTLLMPINKENPPLAILIADYGPVDRNGNQNFAHNDALKKLAIDLAKEGIASFRYDKRTEKLIKLRKSTSKVVFDDFILDANAVIEYFTIKNTFESITIIGHGQGSLVGLLAYNPSVSKLVSIGASSKSIDEVIVEQVRMMDEALGKEAIKITEQLKKGKNVTNVPQALRSVFDLAVQPFMRSWMQYHPLNIIQNLECPVLIVNGTKDLQVSVEEAQSLADSATNSTLEIIKDMNHVFFIIEGNDLENSKSYNESFRTISKELVAVISEFIKA